MEGVKGGSVGLLSDLPTLEGKTCILVEDSILVEFVTPNMLSRSLFTASPVSTSRLGRDQAVEVVGDMVALLLRECIDHVGFGCDPGRFDSGEAKTDDGRGEVGLDSVGFCL